MTWGEAFRGLFTNPLGGNQTQLSLGYAHNLWLDVGWTTGLFPFVLLVFFTLMALKDYYIKLFRSDDLSLYFKYLITAMLCGFFITFMLEPIIEANVLFFCAFCFFSGILRSLNKRNNFVLKRLS
jgi:O-antigen ligase